jgi:hypothetical protein
MPEDTHYQELSDKTISEIKEEVEENDLDLEKLLEVEKDNKDRKTLKNWLEDRMEEESADEPDEGTDDAVPEDSGSVDEEEDGGTKMPHEHVKDMHHAHKEKYPFMFAGVLLGLILGVGLMYGSGGQAPSVSGSTPSEMSGMTGDAIEAIFGQRLPGDDVQAEVLSTDAGTYSDAYKFKINITAGRLGTRTIDAYVTKESGLLFFQPIDVASQEPVSQPLSGTSGTQ